MRINYNGKEHKCFVKQMLQKCKIKDSYHQAFFYTIGISKNTRLHWSELFDFQEDDIIASSISKEWSTPEDLSIMRLAFSLYNDYAPIFSGSVQECAKYSIPELFGSCKYIPFFIEAIKLRYPGFLYS